MPYLNLHINHPLLPGQAKALLVKASSTIAKELGKPERYVLVELTENPLLLFAGTDEPAAYVELKSIGLPAKEVESLSQVICSFLEAEADIPPSRVYIEFTDAKGSFWGWNGGTF